MAEEQHKNIRTIELPPNGTNVQEEDHKNKRELINKGKEEDTLTKQCKEEYTLDKLITRLEHEINKLNNKMVEIERDVRSAITCRVGQHKLCQGCKFSATAGMLQICANRWGVLCQRPWLWSCVLQFMRLLNEHVCVMQSSSQRQVSPFYLVWYP